MHLSFSGEVWHWRGPSPFHFVTVPEEESDAIHAIANEATYGWGMIPAGVVIGETTTATSLWPKDGRYLVPIKAALRKAEGIALGDVVAIELTIDV